MQDPERITDPFDQDAFVHYETVQSNEDVKTAPIVSDFCMEQVITASAPFQAPKPLEVLQIERLSDELEGEKKNEYRDRVIFWLSISIAVIGFLRK